MWTLQPTDVFDRRLRRYSKRYPAATIAVLDNLDRYFNALPVSKLRDLRGGYIHPEPAGVVALDQSGAARKQREMRIYVYPNEKDRILHVITIGDKNSQEQDIKDSSDYVKELRRRTDG